MSQCIVGFGMEYMVNIYRVHIENETIFFRQKELSKKADRYVKKGKDVLESAHETLLYS